MCEPATIAAISAGVSMASTTAAAVGAHQAAGRTDAAAREQQAAASASLVDQLHQRDAQATDAMVQRSKDAMRDSGHIEAIFADSGLSGNTPDRIAAVSEGNAQADLTTIERNRQQASNQGASEADAIRTRAQAEMNGAPRPSVLGTGLQIAAAGTDAYYRITKGNK